MKINIPSIFPNGVKNLNYHERIRKQFLMCIVYNNYLKILNINLEIFNIIIKLKIILGIKHIYGKETLIKIYMQN